MIEITIRRRTPSQNLSAFGGRFAYVKERDLWYALLRAALTPREKPVIRVQAEIISHRNRVLDFGNLVGGCKMIPDGLIRLGYLRDDAPKWFACEYEQVPCKRIEERTVIRLLNINP